MRPWPHALLAAIAASGLAPVLRAQGITTATISGIVRDTARAGLEAARITVTHRTTGVATRVVSRGDGRYDAAGLEPGGPYSLVVAAIGYRNQTRDSLHVGVGQVLRADFALEPMPVELEPITVDARADPTVALRTWIGTIVTDSMLRRLPTLGRDLHGFQQLAPQLATTYGPANTAVNSAYHAILLDGATDQALFAGNPGGAARGGKVISIEAVREYQVILAPFDVRYGDLAGALLNVVTMSGTNRWHGSAFAYAANERLARAARPYDRAQFGITLGGPIVRDRMHMFVATEFQRLHEPAIGSFLSDATTSSPPAPADTATVRRFTQLLRDRGLEAGSAGPITNALPLRNVFARLDLALPSWRSRVVLQHNSSRADSAAFSRPIPLQASPLCSQPSCFPLSSLSRSSRVTKHSTTVRIYTVSGGGWSNEVVAGYTTVPISSVPAVYQPLVLVTDTGTGATLEAGSFERAQQNDLDQRLFEATDNLTLPRGAHRFTVGVSGSLYRLRLRQLDQAFGVWRFSSLDSLDRGEAYDYTVAKDFGGADATLRLARYALYAGDVWDVSDRLRVTLGLRLDVPVLLDHPPYSTVVDDTLGYRTDRVPSGHLQGSPRAGFTWSGSRDQLRGGVGVFVGRPVMAWWLGPYQNYGSGRGLLRCGTSSSAAGLPPSFPQMPDYRNPPTACANGAGFATGVQGPVNVMREDLRFPENLRASLGYDRRLPWSLVGTAEVLYSRARHDVVVVNRRLVGPQGADAHGRVLYGTISTTGVAAPVWTTTRFSEVFELANQSQTSTFSLAAQLQRRFADHVAFSLAYAFARVRDVQSARATRYGDIWASRVTAGSHENPTLEISDFDQPHRVIVTATYAAPTRTDLSLYYVGGSGVPFTYTAVAEPSGRGDLNADGSNGNDPIYVPRDAYDSTEILLAAAPTLPVATQQAALDALINRTRCLREQRGRILPRNSCRSPWVHTLNASLRQSLSPLGQRQLAVVLQVFNLLNLLNQGWGAVRVVEPGLLVHVGETAGATPQPIFRYDPNRQPYKASTPASFYQIQVALRYAF